ncbi:alkaline phosphatase family protein [Chitinophaga horti]|uniref:Alkaline phosphatase family protein n=1 Tax=Chitinophaga horti TaxID=2920382 RepID=A0ABY6J2B6_9BACT|nr:alkaline phosphatase PafA [Chitinophaga horti]UYQ93733.1 alkaline phosphatase family protein [Chitinophaga horti]
MRSNILWAAALLLLSSNSQAQKATSPVANTYASSKSPKSVARPKLVVGMVVDQMRWDYLYRFYDRYSNDGFKRLLREGFTCENTLIPYTPTITACGHTCAYTGSVPAIHGIIGNGWYDRKLDREMYCAEDTTVTTVGSSSKAGRMSPNNMLVTTVADELRMATNYKSRTVGIAIKDRGAILPAGHTANAAYWYDGSAGKFITSSYYMTALPDWVNQFNNKKLPEQYTAQPWNTLYPIATYTLSTADEKPYEGKFKGATSTSFPHKVDGPGQLASLPFGNTYTLDFAKAALDADKLGNGEATDFLAVSLSSTDYVGHQFGPNSIEAEDTYLRLDKDLADFFNYLDKKVGKGQWLYFITADHGVAHVPGYSTENKMHGGLVSTGNAIKNLNAGVKKEFGIDKAILDADNYEVYLNYAAIPKAKMSEVKAYIIDELLKIPGVQEAFDLKSIGAGSLPEPIKQMVTNGYNAKRSGDVMFTLEPGWIAGGNTGTTHGVWNPYDAHIPLVWLGWGIKPGKTNRTTAMTDIAPTIAAMLRIQMPSGNVGHVIEEITK